MRGPTCQRPKQVHNAQSRPARPWCGVQSAAGPVSWSLGIRGRYLSCSPVLGLVLQAKTSVHPYVTRSARHGTNTACVPTPNAGCGKGRTGFNSASSRAGNMVLPILRPSLISPCGHDAASRLPRRVSRTKLRWCRRTTPQLTTSAAGDVLLVDAPEACGTW